MDDSLSATETDSAPSPNPPQQQQQAGDKRFKIPSDLKKGHRTLLAASEADWTLDTVEEIKCRVCPDSSFRTWMEFTRHCNMSEMHPLRILFCDRCGNFFARRDTLERHRKRPPSECLRSTRGMAEAKRRETERAYERFMDGLEQDLSSGEEVKPFSHIVKDMYPESSKRPALFSFPYLLVPVHHDGGPCGLADMVYFALALPFPTHSTVYCKLQTAVLNAPCFSLPPVFCQQPFPNHEHEASEPDQGEK